jgi:predicted SnoaL-like aldol condensation-catalyzing enzyme
MTLDLFAATVRWRCLSVLALLLALPSLADAQDPEENKAIARRFYENVWFAPRTDSVAALVAAEYVVHDIGELKGIREPADAQQSIADFFWQNGTMGGRIDFQIAERDLVATRWQWEYTPRSWWMKASMLGGRQSIPVINVFRIQDGKIVEIWNHRHDIDIGFRANVLQAKGFLAGLLFSGLVLVGRRWWQRRGGGRPAGAAAATAPQ